MSKQEAIAAVNQDMKAAQVKSNGQPDRAPIPIAEIKFQGGTFVDLPGKSGATGLRTESHGAKSWTIEYRPWERWFYVTYIEAKNPPKTIRLHETWIAWVPA